ncbi:sialidase-3-like [Eublepharis macularius]|uniref:exo-alpha-sialidase n=1 Tax=Eublepharis macularius TaxID=481883 RepID=A0AA97J2Y1_EUBMA|nr:sialidase-3-like [Eublepharis macularius]
MAKTQVGSSAKETLFRQEAPGGITYRIPALLFLPDKSLFLAFAEERSSPRDGHVKFLVMRRGQKEGKSVQWGPKEPLTTALLPGHRTMNPCPVYEKTSGQVFLFFICVRRHISEWHQIMSRKNAARLCFVSSQDGGYTWSQLTDLTDQVIGHDLRNWATFAVGPGHGLQMSCGRLVIPAYAYYMHWSFFAPSSVNNIKPHCFIFYSDDHGKNWAWGRLLKSLQTIECQVAELTSQDNHRVLYCNARSPDKYRAEAFSVDYGTQFEESFLCKELPETGNGCQGSVVSFTPVLQPSEPGRRENTTALKTTKSWMVFSHPASRHERVNLGIYLNTSPLVKGNWKDPWVLYEGPSGYSDLAVCEEGQSLLFGCLFECGVSREYEEIAFQLFTDVDLLRNVKEG